jgi:hypothetical protein
MLDRRSFMRLTLVAVAGTTLSACGASSPPGRRPNVAGREVQPRGGGKTLLVYFSRAGENYWNGGRRNLKVGNTEVLAEMIAARLTCDVHRIEECKSRVLTTRAAFCRSPLARDRRALCS